ncbi:hypothetical protein Scep_028523 [Stephania cephalantha]|uniref:F-box domain-containing protein n=1 Tax=Stephania cephalantha TaxID=152367 RepID=A0AAP0EA38_9MAGN
MAKCSKSNLDSPPTPVLVDRISDLPNSILLHILSLLPFKSTATTSILSKRWTNLFQHFLIHTHSFDFGQDFAKAQTQQQFINTVNQYLQLHNGSKIDKFHLLFHPGIQNQVHADKWLEFALERSVKELGFDFCGPITESDDLHSERLTLLDSLYLSNSLTHLKLGQFEFNPPMAFTGFASLVSLYLRRVNITDGNLGSVLMKCPLLTDLSLCECGGLNSIKIFGPKEFLLERLFVGNCYEAYEIEVLAPNLKSFHFYGDLFYGYSFRDISTLEDVYLNSNGFEHTEPDHNYIEILSSVSTVKILTVCTGPLLYMTTAEEYFPEDLPVNLPNLEELQIIVGFPLDEDQLSYFYGFFKHTICPCLDKLFIELCADHFELSWQSQLKEGEAEELAATSFDNLKTIKITNFRGTEIEMRLVKFFLSKSISLEQLVLVAAQDSDLEKQIAGTNDSSMTSITIVDEVLIMPKASSNAKVLVCGDWGADGKALLHTHTNTLQNVRTVSGRTCLKLGL